MQILKCSYRLLAITTQVSGLAALALTASLLLSGCGMKNAGAPSEVLTGKMKGGQQPVTGATIQLYAVGTTGDGSDATPLLINPVVSDSNGSFSIGTATSKDYVCPTPATLVYLVGTGGNPGLTAGTNNPGIALMAALGKCGDLSNSTSLVVNEVTTVAAAAALYPYMKPVSDQGNGYTALGSLTTDATQFASAFALVNEYADIASGSAPGPTLPAGYDASTAKLNTLADILATCINSAGYSYEDGSPCDNLFVTTKYYEHVYPKDTIGAIVAIFQNPAYYPTGLFDLTPAMGPFQPTLPSPPASWGLTIQQQIAAPTFSLPSGSYQGSQMVTLSDSNPSAAIYFTTDGSTPSGSSRLYVAPIALEAAGPETIRAVAYANSVSSAEADAYYNISVDITFSPGPGTYTGQQIVTLTPSVPGSTITYTIDGSEPTTTHGAIYTGPITVSSTETVQAIVDGSVHTGYASATYTIAPYATITTFASGFSGNMAFDSKDNLYVAVSYQNVIQKIAPDGTVSTFAGTGASCANGCAPPVDGTPASSAVLWSPQSIAIDGADNIYFFASGDEYFYKVDQTGVLKAIGGTGQGGGQYDSLSPGSPALMTSIGSACDMVSTKTGYLYFTDCNGGDVAATTAGPYNFTYTLHSLGGGVISDIVTPTNVFPSSLALNGKGYLITGGFSEVFLIDTTYFGNGLPAGLGISSIAGKGTASAGYSGDGWYASAAQLNSGIYTPSVAFDSIGNLYIGDTDNNVIRKVSPQGIISTVVGNGTFGYSGDGGPALSAQINLQLAPGKLAIDSHDNLYIADDNCIRKVTFSATKP